MSSAHLGIQKPLVFEIVIVQKPTTLVVGYITNDIMLPGFAVILILGTFLNSLIAGIDFIVALIVQITRQQPIAAHIIQIQN